MPYRLLQPDGKFVESDVPGTLGGNATLRIYGRLDCESAISALKRGYAKHRVFFANEQAAIDAGFRPCGRCMHEQHAVWKAGPSTAAPYPWHITPKHPILPG
ncbi:MAG TPA: Ada metal-binding domain-containing protein [Gemmatimonadaceae bacterium]|nr:Ada metal-binding domain-containing protein [Gemmatimonadaceae bacterium]